MVNDNESPTMVDGIEFFSTDPHPLQPNIIDDVIEEMKMIHSAKKCKILKIWDANVLTDVDRMERIVDLMFDLHDKRDTTLVLITHDAALADRCGRVVQLSDGQISGDDANLEAAS